MLNEKPKRKVTKSCLKMKMGMKEKKKVKTDSPRIF